MSTSKSKSLSIKTCRCNSSRCSRSSNTTMNLSSNNHSKTGTSIITIMTMINNNIRISNGIMARKMTTKWLRIRRYIKTNNMIRVSNSITRRILTRCTSSRLLRTKQTRVEDSSLRSLRSQAGQNQAPRPMLRMNIRSKRSNSMLISLPSRLLVSSLSPKHRANQAC